MGCSDERVRYCERLHDLGDHPWTVALLGGFVGVIGNLNQLESLGGWLLASPKAAILVSSLAIKCVQDEERTLEFKVHNTSTGTCTFTDLEAKADGTGVLVVEPKPGPLAPLQSGELRVVNCEILPKSVGKFAIVFSAKARAGRHLAKSSRFEDLWCAALQVDYSIREFLTEALEYANSAVVFGASPFPCLWAWCFKKALCN